MIKFLAGIFIKDAENTSDPKVREKYGVLCGAVGVLLNALLFAGKYIAGVLSGSIAITADAFNNLSDAGASVVTLTGFRLAGKRADKEHPFGHGRIEYISGLVVAALILLMGFELAKSSVGKIFSPEAVEMSVTVAVILAVSVLVKLYMYAYNKSVGKKIKSSAMLAAGADALSDCAATLAVLAATLIGHFTNLRIDGYIGAAVSLLIFRAGISAARDTIAPLLGKAPEPELVEEIYRLVLSHEPVCGIHDLVVHDYGPGRLMISLHAEVPADRGILELHDVIDSAEIELRTHLGCEATIHMDPIVTNDAETEAVHAGVLEALRGVDKRLTMHDFRMVTGPTHTNLIFDVVAPFDLKLTDTQLKESVQAAVRAQDGTWNAVIKVDRSYV